VPFQLLFDSIQLEQEDTSLRSRSPLPTSTRYHPQRSSIAVVCSKRSFPEEVVVDLVDEQREQKSVEQVPWMVSLERHNP
jgi:hypothetical protein